MTTTTAPAPLTLTGAAYELHVAQGPDYHLALLKALVEMRTQITTETDGTLGRELDAAIEAQSQQYLESVDRWAVQLHAAAFPDPPQLSGFRSDADRDAALEAAHRWAEEQTDEYKVDRMLHGAAIAPVNRFALLRLSAERNQFHLLRVYGDLAMQAYGTHYLNHGAAGRAQQRVAELRQYMGQIEAPTS